MRIMPTSYFVLLLLLSIALHFFLPLAQLVPPPWSYSGLVLIVFGVVINIWADSIFKREGTTVKPHEKPSKLMDTGPFRLSRHPMYLGMVAALLGAALVMGSLSSFAPVPLFVILMEALFIPLEERNMEKAFGQRYAEYRKRVRRWV